MELYFPRAAPQVCAPNRHNHQFFFICRKIAILGKIFSKLPMCLMGAYTCPTSSEMEFRSLKCVLMPFSSKIFFWNFSKFLPQNPKGKWPYGPFSGFRTFLGITIVLGVLERRLYRHFWLQTLLDTFRGCRRVPHDLRTPGTSVSIATRKWPFCSIFFQAGVPHGCTYFSAGCAPQKGRRGP